MTILMLRFDGPVPRHLYPERPTTSPEERKRINQTIKNRRSCQKKLHKLKFFSIIDAGKKWGDINGEYGQ